MKLLQKKLKNKKGFTLIEMLVVVAIIAILVAISIPMVSGALEKAREAADAANLQAAKSVALVAEMTGKVENESGGEADVAADMYYYDVKNGVLKNSGTPPTADGPQAKANKNSGANDAIIVTFGSDKRITVQPDWGKFTR